MLGTMQAKSFPAELVRSFRSWRAKRKLARIEQSLESLYRQVKNDSRALEMLVIDLQRVKAEIKELS